MEKLDESYWQTRWETDQTGWDIGYPSTPLKAYFDKLTDKEQYILIPGCGNAYEGIYLHELGFKNVYLIDLATGALDRIQESCPTFPRDHLIHGDFFELEQRFDLIIEQTFFCALDLSLRQAYADKMHALLNPHGRLVGLLFKIPLYTDHPPFGGTKDEYLNYFESGFEILHFDEAKNSIPPRAGNELFIELKKV